MRASEPSDSTSCTGKMQTSATELEAARRDDAELDRRWSTIKNWNEQARYNAWTKDQAADIIDAMDGSEGSLGVFQWLSARW